MLNEEFKKWKWLKDECEKTYKKVCHKNSYRCKKLIGKEKVRKNKGEKKGKVFGPDENGNLSWKDWLYNDICGYGSDDEK